MESAIIEYRARPGLEYHSSPLVGTTITECNDYSQLRYEDLSKYNYSNPTTPPSVVGIVSPQPIKVQSFHKGILSET